MKCLGVSCRQFCAKRGRTQHHNHVTDGLLRIHRLLVSQPDDLLSQFPRPHYRLWRLVLPLYFTSYHPSANCARPSVILSTSSFLVTFSYVLPCRVLDHKSSILSTTWVYGFMPGCRFHRLVLPLHCSASVHQQLHQPFHLRRQISRVPGRRQASHVEVYTGSTALASSGFRHFLKGAVKSRYQTTTRVHSDKLLCLCGINVVITWLWCLR